MDLHASINELQISPHARADFSPNPTPATLIACQKRFSFAFRVSVRRRRAEKKSKIHQVSAENS